MRTYGRPRCLRCRARLSLEEVPGRHRVVCEACGEVWHLELRAGRGWRAASLSEDQKVLVAGQLVRALAVLIGLLATGLVVVWLVER